MLMGTIVTCTVFFVDCGVPDVVMMSDLGSSGIHVESIFGSPPFPLRTTYVLSMTELVIIRTNTKSRQFRVPRLRSVHSVKSSSFDMTFVCAG